MEPAAETQEVLAELQRLRTAIPLLSGSLVAGTDGYVLAHDTPGVEPESVAALTATALGVAVRMAEATGRGDFGELLVRGESGCIASYPAGSSAVLTLLAEDPIDVDALHFEGRRASALIGELIDAAAHRATCPAPSVPSPRQLPPQSGPLPPRT
ncbi:roadblock/LC7 domain-containing protein [Streptomyces sp. NPDC059802]|uniref:roadblock/LC7 domain-containing protein n=1 Tax=Streptomyces sp. NPDC059802 TaxID=3346952 RepID=UPI0036485295